MELKLWKGLLVGFFAAAPVLLSGDLCLQHSEPALKGWHKNKAI